MRPKKKPATAGHRVGKKRSDMRWLDGDGVEWDSRLESEVWESAKLAKANIRRCVKGKPGIPGSDTLEYWSPTKRGGSCRACGSAEVGQSRSFTPDLYDHTEVLPARSEQVHTPGGVAGFYIDVKGYMRANKRSLLRSFCKARPDIALRILLQRDYPLSKTTTIARWLNRTVRIPYAIFTGLYPSANDWVMPNESKVRKAAKKSPKGLA